MKMSKTSISRTIQIAAISFGMTALVLSVACAPNHTKSAPITKAALDKFNESTTVSAQKMFPTFQCSSADSLDLSSRIQGATAQVASEGAVDSTAGGPAVAFDVQVQILLTAPDKNVYQLLAKGRIGNDGVPTAIVIDPTDYPAHPEKLYTFIAGCKTNTIKTECRTLFVNVRELISGATATATPGPTPAPVASNSGKPDNDKSDDDSDVSSNGKDAVNNAAVVMVQPAVAAGSMNYRQTVLGFHQGVAQAPAATPAAGGSSAITAPTVPLMPMIWKPGPAARGQCVSATPNSFERATQGLGPKSPFDKTPDGPATSDSSKVAPDTSAADKAAAAKAAAAKNLGDISAEPSPTPAPNAAPDRVTEMPPQIPVDQPAQPAASPTPTPSPTPASNSDAPMNL
jgi:hypothetical protein